MIFNSLNEINGIGPTATTKMLHILKPDLFTAWDLAIAKHYIGRDTEITGLMYLNFLKKVQKFSRLIGIIEAKKLSEYVTRLYETQLKTYNTYDKEINTIKNRIEWLKGNTLTLPKLIDEYNWISITNHVFLPPELPEGLI